MELQTLREKQLDIYLKNPSAQEDQKLRIPLKGKAEHLQVFRVPIKYLIYNIRNGRFAAELLAKESQLKRKLDPAVANDAKIIQKLLLELNQTETEALQADLRDNGQLDPGVITRDGAVINGNRRMAILTALWDETHDPRFEYLRVARLPKDVEEKDLWRIEAGLQFAKEFRLDYSPINELLKLKEGRESGFSSAEISKTLLGRFSASKVDEKLARPGSTLKSMLEATLAERPERWAGQRSKLFESHWQKQRLATVTVTANEDRLSIGPRDASPRRPPGRTDSLVSHGRKGKGGRPECRKVERGEDTLRKEEGDRLLCNVDCLLT